jgi:nitrogen regulatory protein P-II 1
MKRVDLLISHEHLVEVNELLHKHNVGGITFYDVRGRGRTNLESVEPGRETTRRVPEFHLEQNRSNSCRFLGQGSCE